jgi:hypothetical protein
VAADDIILRTRVRPFDPGFCPVGLQATADAIAASLEVFFPVAYTPVIKSPNQPTVEQRLYSWNKVDATTGQSVGVFEWNIVVGQWTRNHWPLGVIPTYERRLFSGSALNAETYDGGQPGTVSASTGPFWTEDATLPVAGFLVLKPTARLFDVAT